ncbi:MAG: hypothetical protein QGG64_08590, partial [Candidatus Latescibacteria bacterium]|nr:hypothetical protein [Candidatus Latescibacterota bacterium]
MINQSVELANAFGRWLFDQLWQMSVELAVLAIVVYGAIMLLRIQSTALRHLFWCLLLAKPVATFLIASPVSLYWFLNPRIEVIAPGPEVVVEEVIAPQRMSYPMRRRI